ncbi:MAG: DUF4388 domain-containing protein [Holophagales bacterium]|nr:DUF4388 domain-containing protein [Holophagales bacterium]
MQLVAVSGKTGMFALNRGAEQGAVYIQNGQITHAKVNDTEGEDAIYALALWNEGQFQFSAGIEPEGRTITRSNTNLLMEAARRSDEWKILSKKIPTTESVPQLVCREGLSEPVTLTPMEWLVVTGIDGARSIEEIAEPHAFRPSTSPRRSTDSSPRTWWRSGRKPTPAQPPLPWHRFRFPPRRRPDRSSRRTAESSTPSLAATNAGASRSSAPR